MTTPRRDPNKAERIAACLLEIKRGDGTPIVSREEAKSLTAGEVYDVFMERVQIDHIVPRAIGGADHHSNYQPLAPTVDHKPKTKRDVREIAKTKRIAKSHTAHESAMAEKISVAECVSKIHTERNGRKWRSAPMPGTKRSGLKKRFSGKVERRGESSSGS